MTGMLATSFAALANTMSPQHSFFMPTSYLLARPGFFPTSEFIAARETTYPDPPCANGNPPANAMLPTYSSSLGSSRFSHATSPFHST